MIDNVMLDSLMTWARLQAPIDYVNAGTINEMLQRMLQRRRVRLEISAEPRLGFMCRVYVCRVYLAEPRCIDNHQFVETDKGYIPCECGQLAETRIA